MRASMSFEVGRIYWKAIRAQLDHYALRSDDFRWIEGKGWLSRYFSVSGPEDEIRAFDGWLRAFVAANVKEGE